MITCHFCHSSNVAQLLDLGQQPISNRFLKNQDESEKTYPLVMNQCRECGLIQVNEPVPASELRPPYDWITYSEPERHLDSLVEIIRDLPGIRPDSTFCGITFKDDSTLARLQKLGFSKTRRLDPCVDLDIKDKGAGAETIQAHLTPQRALAIVEKSGKFDVVILRHILEHVHQVAGFIRALKGLLNDGGYIVFEVPDCSKSLETYDYTTLWEEHTLYFTPVTFKNALNVSGFMIERYECYPYPFENSLVGIVRVTTTIKQPHLPKEILDQELTRADRFAHELPRKADALQKLLKEYRLEKGKIALFGAGHLACAFVNMLGIKDYIDFFVDDNPNKRGLFMPGCQRPIYDSGALHRENVGLCLLSLNPLNESKIVQAHQDWEGDFLSIFPSSSIAITLPH